MAECIDGVSCIRLLNVNDTHLEEKKYLLVCEVPDRSENRCAQYHCEVGIGEIAEKESYWRVKSLFCRSTNKCY